VRCTTQAVLLSCCCLLGVLLRADLLNLLQKKDVTCLKIIISSHLISSHHIKSHLITSHLFTSHLITSHLISSHHITSHHISSHHITSHHITSHHITSHLITSHHISSHHITSHHITSDLITSHHITSHHITSHHITSLQSLGVSLGPEPKQGEEKGRGLETFCFPLSNQHKRLRRGCCCGGLGVSFDGRRASIRGPWR